MNKHKKEWEEVKDKYSQSGLFDNASDLEKELDEDVYTLLNTSYSEGFSAGKRTALDAVSDVTDELVAARQYCEEVHGIGSCKDCSLRFTRLIASLSKEEDNE